MNFFRRLHLTLFALAAVCPAVLHAQSEYPERPVHLVVPFAPGGNVDVVARVIAQALGESLGKAVVVDNKPGANAMIGAEYVARSANDGYTLLLATAETQAINPSIYKTIRYDPVNDFVAIGTIDRFPFSLVVNPKLPSDTLAQFVQYARANPGRLTYASWGIGSSSQIAFEQFKQAAGIDLLHVPYNGASPAITAISSGQVDAFIVPLSVAVPQAKGGRVRLLGVTTDKRAGAAPEVPTLVEQGFPVVIGGWHAIVAPAGTSNAIVDRLNGAIQQVLQLKTVRDTLEKQGLSPAPSSRVETEQMLRAEARQWGDAARKAGIKVD